MAKMVHCVKLGREAEGMDFPPLPGELGKRIAENVSKEAWQGWIKFQTMLINENRLSLADPRARKYLTDSWRPISSAQAQTCRRATPPLKSKLHKQCPINSWRPISSTASCHC